MIGFSLFAFLRTGFLCLTVTIMKIMETKILEKLIGDSTYMVTDNEANRFNFLGLIEVTPEIVQEAKNVIEWDLAEYVPRDVHRALEVMAENDVEMNDFTGIVRVTFENDDTYYLLVWQE